MLATASGAQFGLRRSMPLLAGISVGLTSLAAVAAAGLSGVLAGVPSFQVALKLAGTGYLLWLAWKIGSSGPPGKSAEVARPLGMAAGMGLLWLNPKAWAMCASAAASYGALATHPLQFAVLLGAVLGGASAVSLVAWCAAGIVLSRCLRAAWQWRAVNITLAVLLAASILSMWVKS